MDIQKAMELKNILESFQNVKVDIILENTAIITNKITNASYKISYMYDEIIGPIIDTENAEIISEKKIKPTAKQRFEEYCNILANSIKKVFDGDISDLKQAIHELPNMNLYEILEEINLQNNKKQHNEIIETKLIKLFKDKINKYNVYKNEFEKMLTMFDENNDLIPNKYISLSQIKNALIYLSEQYEQYIKNANIFNNFFEQLSNLFNSEEIAHKFLENFDYDNAVTFITKKLIELNKQYNESIEIVENSKQIYKLIEECDVTSLIKSSVDGALTSAPAPAIFNLAADSKFRPRFFKFKMGIFTPEDVKQMLNEINFIMQNMYMDLTPDDLETLSSYKKTLNYMYHSGQINDHVLMDMINNFNMKYAQDQSGAYNDPSQQLDWKSRGQQREGLAQGFAVSLNSIA